MRSLFIQQNHFVVLKRYVYLKGDFCEFFQSSLQKQPPELFYKKAVLKLQACLSMCDLFVGLQLL